MRYASSSEGANGTPDHPKLRGPEIKHMPQYKRHCKRAQFPKNFIKRGNRASYMH